MKKILYIDMDGVIADFYSAIKALDSRVGEDFSNPELVDAICEANPRIFETLPPIKGAIDAVKSLHPWFDIYFLSTPMWNVPESFTGKRIWIDTHFGSMAHKRLILTHRKDLNKGHFLVDDRIKNGVDKFKGEHIHFGQGFFTEWVTVYKYLMNKK